MSAPAAPAAMSADEFRAAVAKMRASYPDERSAVLPALRLAQERHGGWLPEEAFREVADALDTTPAFCLSIASFYDMFHTEPVGRHLVEVCTNVSCALSGAQDVVEALERALQIHVGETSEDGSVTLRTVECLGGCGWGPVVAVDERYHEHFEPGDAAALVAEVRNG